MTAILADTLDVDAAIVPVPIGDQVMGRYTEENTEGFSAAELATLNAAHERVAAAIPDMDAKSIADALTNSFVDGITLDDLIAAAMARA